VDTDEELKKIAQALFWWERPEQTLADKRRFLSQLMTLCTVDEVKFVRA